MQDEGFSVVDAELSTLAVLRRSFLRSTVGGKARLAREWPSNQAYTVGEDL